MDTRDELQRIRSRIKEEEYIKALEKSLQSTMRLEPVIQSNKNVDKQPHITSSRRQQSHETSSSENINTRPKYSSEVEAYMNREIKISKSDVRPYFRDLPYFCSDMTAERTDFTDLELATKPAIQLIELNSERICKLGKNILSLIQSGTPQPQKVYAAVLILAYQLRAPGIGNTNRVYSNVLPREFNVSRDVPYELHDVVDIQVAQNQVTNAKGYAYIAASMLRLFTQFPENYCRAWNSIRNGFQTFYKERFPITDFTPGINAMDYMHRQFSSNCALKATLYRILYMSNESKEHEALKKFLYDTQLLYTGMHIVPIFCQLRDALNVDSGTLLTRVFGGKFERQIGNLARLLLYMEDDRSERSRHMWRYGRIFQNSFLESLETKYCVKLVYVFALALKKERPEGAENILRIKQFEKLSEGDRKRCELAADLLLKEMTLNLEECRSKRKDLSTIIESCW